MGFVKKVVGGVTNAVGAGKMSAVDPNDFAITKDNQAMLDKDYKTQQAFVNQLQGQVGGYDPLIQMLSAQARGEGPSFADMQMQEATQRNIAQQMGQAAANRGVNPALAARMAGQNIANLGQEAAMDSSQLRLAEMLQAQQQEVAARQAQSGTSTQGGNLVTGQRTLSQQQAENDRQARINAEEMNQQRYEGGQKRRGELVGNLAGGAAAILSDKDAKTGVKKTGKDMDKFLEAIESYTYSYNDDPDKEKHVGVMAQDLEKSKLGKLLIEETPKGKAIDMSKALSAVLAAQGHLNKKIREA